jgi:hypothetical protein
MPTRAQSSGIAEGHDHRRPLRNEFRGESWQALHLAVSKAEVEGDIPPFDVAERLHVRANRVRERLPGVARKDEQNTEHRRDWLLPARGKRQRGDRAANE